MVERLGSVYPGYSKPVVDFIVKISDGMQLQMMNETPRRRFYDFLPSQRAISKTKSRGEYKGSKIAMEVSSRYPYPHYRLLPPESNLAFRHTNFSRANGINSAAHSFKKWAGILTSQKKLIKCHYSSFWSLCRPAPRLGGYLRRKLSARSGCQVVCGNI